MSGDFTGLKVIWPPDGTRPPKHEHDVVFVHGLSHGSVSDWQDEAGVCWPAENLSLDLGSTRILAFGYDQKCLDVSSDGMYEGGVVLNSGRLLCHAVKTARKRDKAQVPLTLIGHGTGGIVVRSALCFSYSNQDRFGLILQKTKHVLFLDTPRSDLSQDAWKCISRGSSSEESIGGWKAWSTALARSHKVFNEMSRHFNITSAFAELDSHLDVSDISANLDVSGQTSLAREEHIILENTNHRTISQLSRGSVNYNWLVRRIQEGSSRITQNPEDIERIRVWIGRRPDVINRADQKRNLELHQAGTGNWLFEDRRFRQWATLGETSPLLWLTGPEGCGKSVLCSLATDRIRQSPQQHAIAYLMLAFDKPQSQYQILTQLALQLLDYVVRTQGGVDTEALLRLPEDHDTGSRVARIRDLIKVLVSQCPAVFFFIDGLDEVTSAEGLSSQPEQHTKLDKVTEQLYGIVSFLVDLAQADSATPVRLWLSSLKTDHISKWMQEFGGDELPADESAIALDVSHFFQDRMVKAEATESPEPDAMVSLCKAVGCNFLIASMITEEWQRSGLSSINGFRHSITDGVRELYADCLEKLKSLEKGTDQDDGRGNAVPAMHILSLLTSARRPLKMKEMREAVAILQKPFHDESEFCCEDLAPDDIKQLDGSDIERYCTPFVSFVPSEEETEDSYIRLSHVSVLHFLRELASSPVYEQGEPRIITNIMSDACLRYLSQRKYAITPEARTEAFQDDSFLAYAAKYWHRHLDESSSFPTEAVQSFICSPQFITVVQTQSLLLNGHFGRVDDDGKESQQVPASFSTRADLQALAHDYRQFIKEWSEFLQLGVTNARLHGAIQHCFWGALGETNFLWKHGSGIESNASFLLDFDASQDDNEAQESGTSYYYDMISEDGRRLAVWKIPIRSEKIDEPKPNDIQLVRESWYIDGYRPPVRYDSQGSLTIDSRETRWDSYNSSHADRFSLVPTLTYPARTRPLSEYKFGTAARAGHTLFQREKEGGWTARPSRENRGIMFWEDITVQGPWTVRSRRQRIGLKTGGKTTAPKRSAEVDDSDSDADAKSDSDGSDLNSSEERNAVSSAEEFNVDSDIDSSDESSQDDFWASTRPVSDSSSSNESDDESDLSSDLTSDSGSATKPKRTKSSINSKTKRTSHKSSASSDTSSEADDEKSASENESDSETEPLTRVESRPQHQFSLGRYCDICRLDVVSFANKSKSSTYYQCNPCGARSDDSYDICSSCFNKGLWCKNSSHLLSKAVATYRDKRVLWADGISQDSAMPLISIVGEYRDKRLGSTESIVSFRYTHRHHSMLHDSQPIIHPTLPLVVYPLDGRELLFGQMDKNVFFRYEVPYDASEMAETSGNMCIPISVSLRLSPCGKYIHLARITARNDSPLYGPLKLSASVLTIALSSKDACSGTPRTLPHIQTIDLGKWPKLIMQLPYAITWTDSHAYVALSSDFLRVFRFTLHTDDTLASIKGGAAETNDNDICTLSREVPLPRSTRSRSVHFYPNEGKSSARILLRSSRGDSPQPPIVVYLKPENIGDWVRAKDQTELTTKSPQIRRDLWVQEPDVDDDYSPVVKASTKAASKTISPFFDQRIRTWLESGFKERGMYCPSCFDLALKLPVLRLPNSIEVIVMDGSERPEDMKLNIAWTVNLQTLIEALKADCQFCCYVATKLFSFSHISHTSQFIASKGPRCCSQGAATEDRKDVEKSITNLQERFEWTVKPEERVFRFICEPLDQDPETRSFSKLSIRLPSITVGNRDANAPFIPTMLTVSGVQESGEAQTFTSFIYSPQSAQGNPECVLELYTLPSDAAHEIMPTRPLATSRGKDENIEVTKAWLEECQSHHAFCRRNEDTLTQLPARLIEISDDETAQLVETSDQVGRYVALSYCWGENPEENRITTVQNIQMRLLAGSLPRDELPGAIRDGLAVAEQLGIKYIWVDAFCIIQDDQDDKNEELSKMGQYYKNSYLTIAASTPRCTTGFIDTIGRCEKHPKNLLPRDLVPLHVFCIAQDKDEGHSGRVYAREENPYQLSMEPLNRRAWALQESLLSPRVLFFGSRTIWFCRHMTHSDGGIEDWSFEENELERTRREFQIELSKLDKSGSDDQLSTTTESGADGSRGMYNMWHRIVGTYSQRSMSRPEDKLPAISAVAAEFARLSKDEYLAGLWRSNLARDLLWTTPDPATHRPETWRAPTWSWASIDDPILYEKPPPADAILLAKIEEVGTTPRTMTVPFGEVARGSLRMTAPCFNQDLGKVDDDARDKTSRMWLDGFKWKGGKTERAMLLEALRKHARGGIDKKEDGDGEDKTYRLPDLVTVVALYGVPDQIDGAGAGGDPLTEVKHWRVWGLILKPVDAPGGKVYERVISFSRMPLRFTDPAKAFDERRTIDII